MTEPDSPRQSLITAVGLAGALPALCASAGVATQASLVGGAALMVVALVFAVALPATVPLALATLARYRRQMPPSPTRTVWSLIVWSLLALPVGVVAWDGLTLLFD